MDLLGDGIERGVVGDADELSRIDRAHGHAVVGFVDDDVTRQERTQFGFFVESLVSELWVTRAEDAVLSGVDVEFLFERLTNVDVAEDAESSSSSASVVAATASSNGSSVVVVSVYAIDLVMCSSVFSALYWPFDFCGVE